MILSSVFAFLGGSAFRMMWGEISHWITTAREHKREIERMRVQGELDAAQHSRNMESIKLQADLGVREIRVKGEMEIERILADAWGKVAEGTTKPVGIAWVDAWNAAIRPALASWSVAMLTFNEFGLFIISDNTSQVCFAVLGLYVADRTLGKRGK